MSGIAVGSIIFAILMVMLVIRVPIGIAMFVTGAGGYLALTGWEFTPLLNILKQVGYARLSNYDLVVIPLFLLMGQFATHGGLSAALFRFVAAFMGYTNVIPVDIGSRADGRATCAVKGGDVLLITDGEIWQADEMVAAARTSGHRVFAIGVGSAPAEGVLRSLAEATGGACEVALDPVVVDAPLPARRVVAGRHAIRVEAPGRPPVLGEVDVGAKRMETFHAALLVEASPSPSPSPSLALTTPPIAPNPSVVAAAPPQEEESSGAMWWLLGGGAVAVAAGVVIAVVATSAGDPFVPGNARRCRRWRAAPRSRVANASLKAGAVAPAAVSRASPMFSVCRRAPAAGRSRGGAAARAGREVRFLIGTASAARDPRFRNCTYRHSR